MKFFIPGPQYSKKSSSTSDTGGKKWKDIIEITTKNLEKIDGPCNMKIEYIIPYERFDCSLYGSDLDNLTKPLLDGLKRTIFNNSKGEDGSIIEMGISKRAPLPGERIGTKVSIYNIHQLRDNEILYFSYGSNMSEKMLSETVKEYRKECIAFLPNYRLRFNNISTDGFKRANIERCESETVWGVVWKVSKNDKDMLDRDEGYYPGKHDSDYKPIDVTVYDSDGLSWRTVTYIACEGRSTDDDSPMYAWYHNFLLNGAKENALPEEYIKFINNLPSTEDFDRDRHDRNMRIS